MGVDAKILIVLYMVWFPVVVAMGYLLFEEDIKHIKIPPSFYQIVPLIILLNGAPIAYHFFAWEYLVFIPIIVGLPWLSIWTWGLWIES